MDIQDYAAIAGMASIIISGACLVLTWIARIFWTLTFKRKSDEDEKRFSAIEAQVKLLEEAEKKNEYYRHNFDTVTKSIMQHITNEIKHLQEIIELKFKLFEKDK